MIVADIVEKYLKDNNFDGLTSGECSCAVNDLMPCGEGKSCEPAYNVKCNKQCKEYDYCLNTEKDYVCDITDDEVLE